MSFQCQCIVYYAVMSSKSNETTLLNAINVGQNVTGFAKIWIDCKYAKQLPPSIHTTFQIKNTHGCKQVSSNRSVNKLYTWNLAVNADLICTTACKSIDAMMNAWVARIDQIATSNTIQYNGLLLFNPMSQFWRFKLFVELMRSWNAFVKMIISWWCHACSRPVHLN